MVFDFVHASVLRPDHMPFKTVCFTHNVEAEIFSRHAQQARDPARRWMWRSQHAKMVRFEGSALRGYDKVIAVSERDAQHFAQHYGVAGAEAIPTGVDLDHFGWQLPPGDGPPTAVFTGSMDSAANIDGVQFFLCEIWPRVLAALPVARFIVVGRHPPASLLSLGRKLPNVEFTGFVDDVRPCIRRAHVSVIPLLVGGGTRIKAFEAMAMGSPVVSTSVGIEGLDVQDGLHYLKSDAPAAFADAVVHLLQDRVAREGFSRRARQLVEERFGHRVAARHFEDICLRTLGQRQVAA
jgi:glycosyltransferase involved in cell wall biosynthesis